MGLRKIFLSVNWGDLVDDICTDVYEAWMTPGLVDAYDPRVVIPAMRERFGFDDLFEYWEQKRRREERLQYVPEQLMLQLSLPDAVVIKVLGFLFEKKVAWK